MHDELDRAVTAGSTPGWTKLVVDKNSRIVGATVVSPRAGETLGELTLAIRHGMRTRDIAGATHPYPTYNDGVWNAAIADVRRSLTRQPVALAMRTLVSVRRRWLARAQR